MISISLKGKEISSTLKSVGKVVKPLASQLSYPVIFNNQNECILLS